MLVADSLAQYVAGGRRPGHAERKPGSSPCGRRPKARAEAWQIGSHPLRCSDGQANRINVVNEPFKKET